MIRGNTTMAHFLGGLVLLLLSVAVDAFSPQVLTAARGAATSNQSPITTTWMALNDEDSPDASPDAVQAAIDAMYGGKPESPEATKSRIEGLVQDHQVLLFMKGSKVFPQCGFSDTATKILEACKVADFHAVDVLADEAIRQGIKEFSQWPTIPQLYVRGEFIGGSDVMLEMYENGELAELLNEEAK